MNRVSLIAAGFAGLISATAASAQTFDAFTSFDGTQGAGNFYYGEADSSQPNVSGTFFAANTNCFIAGSTCLQRAPNFDVPGVTKSTTPSFQYGSVDVPDDRLLAHPGENSLQTFLAFVAPTAAIYRLDAIFNIQDRSPTGVGINLITTTNGGLPLNFTPLATIDGSNPVYNFSRKFALGQSFAAGFGLDNAGQYFNDSTGVQFSATQVSGVPESATWALMLTGFGLAGAAFRRRSGKMASVTA